jgi:hypothetical protein
MYVLQHFALVFTVDLIQQHHYIPKTATNHIASCNMGDQEADDEIAKQFAPVITNIQLERLPAYAESIRASQISAEHTSTHQHAQSPRGVLSGPPCSAHTTSYTS